MDQFTIRIAKPKGHSMFANNPIRRGARIIAETPLLWIRTGVSLDLFDEDAFVSAGDRSVLLPSCVEGTNSLTNRKSCSIVFASKKGPPQT